MSSETFQDRLRRLRREGARPEALSEEGVLSENEPAPERGLPDWFRRKGTGRRAREEGERAEATAAALCPTTMGEPEALEVCAGTHGPFATRATEFPRDHQHGTWRLDECVEVDPSLFALLSADEALADLDLTRAVFLDTETTGLSGGAGVYVYMIGLGWFEGERFRLWQGFLREPDEERALLAEAARIVGEADAVVSFFGKSFDRHRLEDKMRITGIEPPFAGRPHLDLYHPFRRLTLGSLDDGRLATVESALVGLERQDDLPGALAPAAWFDFLAGRAHRLEGVFRHNRDDVLSLVTLAAYLGRVEDEKRASGEPLIGCSMRRARAIGRAYIDAGQRSTALLWLDRVLERARDRTGDDAPDRDPSFVRETALLRAETLRRAAEADCALEAFQSLVHPDEPEDEHTLPALLALAKLLEHGFGDASAALEACERARGAASRASRVLARDTTDLDKRLTRLRHKVHSGPG